ncbi:MAG: TAXI family TRAP transporter solute-binding subunit [Geminicoccaceae bacterium]
MGQQADYDPDEMRETVNRGTVMIQGAKQDSAFTRLANDMATVVDSDDIRVLPLLGKGSFQNIMDLMFLSGVDATFTRADTLEFYKSIDVLPHLDRDLRYIMRTSNEEYHLLAKTGIGSIHDLAGKRVNFGEESTGTFITSSLIFDRLGLSVEATTYSHKQALALLKAGDIDAMAKVDGKPVGIIGQASIDDGLQLLEIPAEKLLDTYDEAELLPTDYPRLISNVDKISTIAVPSLLAVYNFEEHHPRAQKIDNFIGALFENFDDLQSAATGGDSKWADIDLDDTVPGWTRHPTVDKLLDKQ